LRSRIALAAGTLTASLLGACSPATLLGAVQPRAAGGELHGVAYEPGPRHQMDIYLPSPTGTAPPVAIFFYGGGWTHGDRATYSFVGRSLAACGVMTVIPDYRVWPETGFPGFLRDAAASVGLARDAARLRGGDLSRLFLIGHSAGAYIALMLTLDPVWLSDAGVDARNALAGAAGISGPYDFLPLKDPVLESIFAPAGPNTQPITFAANAKVPLLLATGAADTTVYPANTVRLADKVRESGGRVETIIYPGLGHVGAVAAFAAPFRFLAPVRADVCRFLGQDSRITAAASSPFREEVMAR
jgi:acetyl esterase/lipase